MKFNLFLSISNWADSSISLEESVMTQHDGPDAPSSDEGASREPSSPSCCLYFLGARGHMICFDLSNEAITGYFLVIFAGPTLHRSR